ncbi:MAG: hypothetical protein K2L13_01670 [Opitutales bacterium]|nr:hypothetical protein [Opitutales bacterium]
MIKFQEHLERIKLSSKRASEILTVWSSIEEATMASVALAWEHLFDTLCNDENISLADLSTITGVIQKLSATSNSVKQGKNDPYNALSPEEIIKHAEEQLRLL